jgi:hypothetical protein
MLEWNDSRRDDPTTQSEWVSRVASALVAAGYLVFALAIGSYKSFVGFVPYLALALICTCIPRSIGQGWRSYDFDPAGRRLPWFRWRWTPPQLVMAGGWLLLLLPAVVGLILWSVRKG